MEIPEDHPLYEPLRLLLQFISNGDCDIDRLTRALALANANFRQCRDAWAAHLGPEREDQLDTLVYFILNHLSYFLREAEHPSELMNIKDLDFEPKRRPNFPKNIVVKLESWLLSHPDNPYPDMAQKKRLSEELGLSIKQINDWFINGRRRKLSGKK